MDGEPIVILLRWDDHDLHRLEEVVLVVLITKGVLVYHKVHHPMAEWRHPYLPHRRRRRHLLSFTHLTGTQPTQLLIMATIKHYITHKYNSHNITSNCMEHLLLPWALPITMVILFKPQLGVHILLHHSHKGNNAYRDHHIYTILCKWRDPSPPILLHLFKPRGNPFLLLQIHRRHSKIPLQKQKLQLLLQIVQIPKRRTYQYIHGLDISFNCITLTNLCQSTLFSFLKFSTVYIILWFNQSCNIRTASTDYLNLFFSAMAGKDGLSTTYGDFLPQKIILLFFFIGFYLIYLFFKYNSLTSFTKCRTRGQSAPLRNFEF